MPTEDKQIYLPFPSRLCYLQGFSNMEQGWAYPVAVRLHCEHSHCDTLNQMSWAVGICPLQGPQSLHCPSAPPWAACPFSHAELFPLSAQCAESQNAHQTQSDGLVKTSPWKGILAFLVSWTRRKLHPHGFRCVRLVLTFHAFHKGNSQMTDVLGHAHVTPQAAWLVLLKHSFP